MGVLDEAYERQAGYPAPKRIDYDRMNRHMPAMKAALTRAKKTNDPERIAVVCKQAVEFWNTCGAWPDNWATWQVALDDALPWHAGLRLEDL